MMRLATAFAASILLAASAPEPGVQGGQLAPEIEQSLAMRASWKVSIPKSDTTIYIHSVAVHHVRSEQSTIAWRDQQGIWTISQVVQDGPGGLLTIEKQLIRQEVRRMAASDERKLDKLLEGRALLQEKPRRTGTIGVGAPLHVMEIVTSTNSVVVRWDGRLRGKLGRVADILLGRG
jgi:hypothetical protein